VELNALAAAVIKVLVLANQEITGSFSLLAGTVELNAQVAVVM